MLNFGLIGEKLGHSISPQIHSLIFKETGITGNYKLYEIPREKICDIKSFIFENSLDGINVTIPYKQEIMPYLDEISTEAEQIGAVNTVLRKGEKLIGYNTDYYGFGAMLEYNGIKASGREVLILGNGGAAKCVIAYAVNRGADKVFVASRNPAKTFDERITMLSYDDISNLKPGYLIVNTTPVGMYPDIDRFPVNDEAVKNCCAVVDLIYNPRETMIMAKGKSFSKPCCNGLYMLVGQAVRAQEIWQGRTFGNSLTKTIYDILVKEER